MRTVKHAARVQALGRARAPTARFRGAPSGVDLGAARASLALFGREPARLVFQHHRDAVADRIGEARRLRHQLLALAIVDERRPWSPGKPGFRAVWRPRELLASHALDQRRIDVAPRPADTSSARRRSACILPRPSRSSGSRRRRAARGRRRRSDDDRRNDARVASMPSAAQQREKALRIADAGDGVHAQPATRRRGSASATLDVVDDAAPRQRSCCDAPSRFARVGARRRRRRRGARSASTAASARRGLAQRPGRQQPAVAEAARSHRRRDLDVARERVVLQPVVAEDHVQSRMRGEQRARGRGAIARRSTTGNPARGEQQRLVADVAPDRRSARHGRRRRARCRRSRG